MPLPRVAGVAAFARELLGSPNVHDDEPRVTEAAEQLLPGRYGVEAWRQLHLALPQLDDTGLQLAMPGGESAGEYGNAGMTGQLRDLRHRGSRDAVAPVVEDEPLLPCDSVPAQPEPHLRGER